MKEIIVSRAIILRLNSRTNKKKLLATQRGYGDYKDGWKFTVDNLK